MKPYQTPVMKSESIECSNAVGQYIFEFTPGGCSSMSHYVGQADGLAFCSGGGAIAGNFTAEITCQNIEGTFTVSFGVFTPGGGLNCPNGESIFIPILNISPELPGDCIVDQFLFEGEFDDCDGPR